MSIALERRTFDRRVTDDRRRARTPAEDMRARMLGAAMIAVLSVADVVTSAWLRSHGGTEVNPIGQWLIAHDLLIAAKCAGVGAVVLLLRRARPRPWVIPSVWFVAGLYAALIALHVGQLRMG